MEFVILDKMETKTVIPFTKSKLPYGWCGNMSPYPVTYDGKMWRTTEALFQALRFDDEKIQEEIRECKSPMIAKLTAKKYVEQMVIVPMGKTDVDNMRLMLRIKTEQHPELLEALKMTKDATIVEDCTSRGKGGSNLFWGAVLEDDVWVGKNIVGRLWMELRAKSQ